MIEYAGILIMFLLAALLGAAFIVLASTLGPKKPSAVKSEAFECGEKAFSMPTGRFAVKFYLVGMLFILFDVEMVFLLPWAVVCRQLGTRGFIEMLFFLGLVMVGFVYAWKKGAFNWE